MNEINTVPEYLLAHFAGKATESQENKVADWLKIDGNKEVYKKLKKLLELTSDYNMLGEFDLKKARVVIEKRRRKSNIRRLMVISQRVAAILFIPVLLLSVWKFIETSGLKSNLEGKLLVQEISTTPGLRSHFFLPDSTEVWLNSASSLKFPTVFTGDTRTVEIDGEGYFKVFKNKEKPFIVKSKDFEVIALGTAFNICAYSNDPYSSTTLEEGLTEVIPTNNENVKYRVKPGERVKFSENRFIQHKVIPADVIAWKDGKLVFNQTPLNEIASRLNKWFNVDFHFEDETVKKYRYTATFTNENLEHILELLELSAPIDYEIIPSESEGNNKFTRRKVILKTSRTK